ncbi:MAG: hypothetical protein RIC03_02610 [Cyclobacteriaceae bacterium]
MILLLKMILVELKYGTNFGFGTKVSVNQLSTIISYCVQNMHSSTRGEVRYKGTLLAGTSGSFVTVRGENFLGNYAERIGRLEFTFLNRVFQQ